MSTGTDTIKHPVDEYTDAEYLAMTHAQLSELPGDQFMHGFALKTAASVEAHIAREENAR